MNCDHSDASFPHSPDVRERETADGGFSRGWGLHFMPAAEYWADMHGHIQLANMERAGDAVRAHFSAVAPLGVRRAAACSPVMAAQKGGCGPLGMDIFVLCGMEELRPYLELAGRTDALSLMLFLHHGNPDARLLRESAGGICGVKLHNAPLIVNGVRPDVWLGGGWPEAFEEIQRAGLPVLWHVTQRLSGSPYTGGGRNTYWTEGWKKGVEYTNEDLLQVFLRVVKAYPGIPFIGAHQLHLGWERLDKLMAECPNLHIDTSVGCVVREGDRLYDGDRDVIRDFFIRHSGRILFGTDCFIVDEEKQDHTGTVETVKNHIRFLQQLRLPYDALQAVSHGNAERLMKLPPLL